MPLIKNFGHRWDNRQVSWGFRGRNNAGSLLGFKNGDKNRLQVDFRKQIGIYILWDKNDRICYVGEAKKGSHTIFNRLKNHMNDHLSGRWIYFSWFGLCEIENNLLIESNIHESVEIEKAAIELESVLITLLEPHLNKQGPKWPSTNQYIQWVEYGDDFEIVTKSDLRELRELIEEKRQ